MQVEEVPYLSKYCRIFRHYYPVTIPNDDAFNELCSRIGYYTVRLLNDELNEEMGLNNMYFELDVSRSLSEIDKDILPSTNINKSNINNGINSVILGRFNYSDKSQSIIRAEDNFTHRSKIHITNNGFLMGYQHKKEDALQSIEDVLDEMKFVEYVKNYPFNGDSSIYIDIGYVVNILTSFYSESPIITYKAEFEFKSARELLIPTIKSYYERISNIEFLRLSKSHSRKELVINHEGRKYLFKKKYHHSYSRDQIKYIIKQYIKGVDIVRLYKNKPLSNIMVKSAKSA